MVYRIMAAATIILMLGNHVANAEDNKIRAAQAFMFCVRDNVAKLDDGKMDAKDLAAKIIPICHNMHEASEQAIQPGTWNSTTADNARDLEFVHTWAAVQWARKSITQGQ